MDSVQCVPVPAAASCPPPSSPLPTQSGARAASSWILLTESNGQWCTALPVFLSFISVCTCTCTLNNFQLLESVGQVSRMKSKKCELIQENLEGLFQKLQCNECLVPNAHQRVPIESNFNNTCMYYKHEIESKWTVHVPSHCESISRKSRWHQQIYLQIILLVLLSLIVNVPFSHEDGDGELCKFDIILVVF